VQYKNLFGLSRSAMKLAQQLRTFTLKVRLERFAGPHREEVARGEDRQLRTLVGSRDWSCSKEGRL